MKRALIVGASHSLGAHLARGLAERGWSVVGTGRRPAAEVPSVHTFEYRSLDLSVPGELQPFLDRQDGGYDLIVHNAVSYGRTYRGQGTGEPHLAELETLFRVNALMPYQLLHSLLAAQPADRFCSCVVVNSDAIHHANRHSGAYAASKAALRVLTTALADTFRSGDSSVATLLLGPLADPQKLADLERLAKRHSTGTADVARAYLRKANPSYVIDDLIDFESCLRSVEYLAGLGRAANGMVCKLDGGSSGSLV
ncbi:SDR family NAD(P)-dependent oxidoreductase [Streptomyces sp. NPDC051217]|uniref:SDR family NAD(P)-dependent oxidoreductase n=1 Tax=Streptomyces sp. NPDC051217 TaxID=3365644 RepID=UPI003798F7CA